MLWLIIIDQHFDHSLFTPRFEAGGIEIAHDYDLISAQLRCILMKSANHGNRPSPTPREWQLLQSPHERGRRAVLDRYA
ncbi:hypothetical protein [Bradyrhizobium sp. RDI18]|uniref:hypothetical protein n=1 Tax=Bradyrhizobium sp. RDI18 TaxID=3367400 RepID=UPI0037195AC7